MLNRILYIAALTFVIEVVGAPPHNFKILRVDVANAVAPSAYACVQWVSKKNGRGLRSLANVCSLDHKNENEH